MTELFVAVAGTYGVSTLVSDYPGPLNMFDRLRNLSTIFECSVCLTPWIALPIAFGVGLSFFQYLAVVGIVILIERLYDSLF